MSTNTNNNNENISEDAHDSRALYKSNSAGTFFIEFYSHVLSITYNAQSNLSIDKNSTIDGEDEMVLKRFLFLI